MKYYQLFIYLYFLCPIERCGHQQHHSTCSEWSKKNRDRKNIEKDNRKHANNGFKWYELGHSAQDRNLDIQAVILFTICT